MSKNEKDTEIENFKETISNKDARIAELEEERTNILKLCVQTQQELIQVYRQLGTMVQRQATTNE
jgi:flagellar motility protein MotE (MotC chaperone)